MRIHDTSPFPVCPYVILHIHAFLRHQLRTKLLTPTGAGIFHYTKHFRYEDKLSIHTFHKHNYSKKRLAQNLCIGKGIGKGIIVGLSSSCPVRKGDGVFPIIVGDCHIISFKRRSRIRSMGLFIRRLVVTEV